MAIKEQLLQLFDLFLQLGEINKDPTQANLKTNIENEFNKLWEAVEEELLNSPGRLIYVEDKNELQTAKLMATLIWDSADRGELFEEILGKYSQVLNSILGEYIDNAKQLKPTFISVNPDRPEFNIYYDEAMKAWLYGLYNSALIICCSLIEDVLKKELYEINFDLAIEFSKTESGGLKGFKNRVLNELIRNAYEQNILDRAERKEAIYIKNKRNDAVHGLEPINSLEVYEVITRTKNLIEKIYSRNDSW